MSKNFISIKVKCPHCNESFMDDIQQLNNKPSIKLNIELGDKKGVINLCSTYGCYDKVATITLVEKEVAGLICPSCNKNLAGTNNCDICTAPIADFDLFEGGKVHVCTRVGCKKHYVSFEDIYDTLTKFYDHYEYGADKDF